MNRKEYVMSRAEQDPLQSPKPVKRRFESIKGEGAKTWSRTAAELNVTTPITSEAFEPSNLLRKLRSKEDKVETTTSGEKINLLRTRRAAIIGEVYRRLLRPQDAEFGSYQQGIAEAEEADFVDSGLADDEEYKAMLATTAQAHQDSLLIQGIRAFRETADDFFGTDIHGQLFDDTELFAAHLILENQ